MENFSHLTPRPIFLIFATIPSFGGFVKSVKIVSIESDFGAGTKGAKLGPQALLKTLPKEIIDNIPIEVVEAAEEIEPKETEYAHHIDAIIDTQTRAIKAISQAMENGSTPWIISGDHSNGLAAISAYKNKYPKNNLGVIWIDAHADMHTPYTSPSGNMHGMPLGAALGLGQIEHPKNKPDKYTQTAWVDFTELGSKRITPKIAPTDLVFIDIRDLEPEETLLLNQLQIRHYTPETRKEIGLQKLMEETIRHLSHCQHILVSFDVDSMDPSFSSGTGTPVHDGLSLDQAVELLSNFLSLPNLFAFEITEINPLLDRHHPMEIIASEVIKRSFAHSGFGGLGT